MPDINWTAFTFLAIDWLIRVALIIRIIMSRRPVPASLAWMVLLLWIPIVGILLYLLIGENKLGRRRIKRFERLTAGMEARAVNLWQHRSEGFHPSDDRFEQLDRIARAVGGMPPLKGNKLTLLTNAEEMIDSLIRDIDGAQSHCHLLYYLWMRGGKGDEVAEALVRAAGRGVTCRVLVDGVGAKHFMRSALRQRLVARGVHVLPALPVNPLRMLVYRLDLRNHRKIAVIDGRVAYTGSQNLNDSTFRSTRWIDTGPWIDASVRVEGPAAQALGVVFLMDWQLDSDEDVSYVERYLPDLGEPEQIDSVVQVVPSGPGGPAAAIQEAILTAIYAAREEIVVTTPYFVPDEATKSALVAAALRGVAVTIVVPSVHDAPLVAAASRSHFQDFLDAGIRIARYRAGLLHAKTMTVDRRFGMIGSANLDMRSFWLNFEITLFVYDDDFASVMRFMQTDYLARAEDISPDDWRRRPVVYRFADNIARLFSPLL